MNVFFLQDLKSAIQSTLRERGVQLTSAQSNTLLQYFVHNEHLIAFQDGGKIAFKGSSLAEALDLLVAVPKETTFIV